MKEEDVEETDLDEVLDETWSTIQSTSARISLIAWIPKYNGLVKGLVGRGPVRK